jgi:hypothetical protein
MAYRTIRYSLQFLCVSLPAGADLEAEDSDGDTALHLVLIQLRNLQQRQVPMGLFGLLFMNVSSDESPDDLDKAPQIYKVR